MSRFLVETFEEDSLPVAKLSDTLEGTEALIALGYGFNCYRFTRRGPAGPEEYIHSDPAFPFSRSGPNLNGIPILFPFPNRIAGGRFVFEGREVVLPRNEGGKNAIHGLVLDRPWETASTDTRRKASVTGRISTDSDGGPAALWPFPFRLEVTYTLFGKALSMEAVFHNPGPGRLPCGFGSHGYFRVPGAERVDDLRLTAPFGCRYELRDLLPTGKKIPLDPEDEPYLRGAPVGGRVFDTVYGDLTFQNGKASVRLEGGERGLEISWDSSAPILILYTPPHREAVAVEPYTCLTDAFNLASRGVESGALFLEPGEQARTAMEIAILD